MENSKAHFLFIFNKKYKDGFWSHNQQLKIYFFLISIKRKLEALYKTKIKVVQKTKSNQKNKITRIFHFYIYIFFNKIKL